MSGKQHVVALCGGVGGAKLAFGLTRLLPPERLSIVINTGDDFTHLGFYIAPDIDTVTYTIADLADRERGWGLRGESWAFMDAIRAIGGEGWFQLGDRDLATHVERTRRMAAGESLSQVTAALANAHGIAHPLIPMTDAPVRTMIDSDQGELAFQRYFVREQCRPKVNAIRFAGAEAARPALAVQALFDRTDIGAVLICPSNPYLSIDPILAVPGIVAGLKALGAPIVAVSPIVGGQAVKGPTAKLMGELGIAAGNAAIAAHYRGLIDGLVIDAGDAADGAALEADGLAVLATPSVMRNDEDRIALAQATLDFATGLARP